MTNEGVQRFKPNIPPQGEKKPVIFHAGKADRMLDKIHIAFCSDYIAAALPWLRENMPAFFKSIDEAEIDISKAYNSGEGQAYKDALKEYERLFTDGFAAFDLEQHRLSDADNRELFEP